MRTFTFTDPTGLNLHVYRWSPDPSAQVRGIVQIAHGMVETAARYERFARYLAKAGYIVYAHDHRGHGKTAGSAEKVGIIGDNGFYWMVENIRQLNGIIRETHRGVPLILFGHSMGAFLAQRYGCLYGDTIQGLILSGNSGKLSPLVHAGVLLAKGTVLSRGPHYRSRLLHSISLGSYNKQFRPVRTEYDWLSRDPEEVDKYALNPYCGVPVTAEFHYQLFALLRDNYKEKLLRRIPKSLPVLLMSGGSDPLGGNGKGVLKLYRKLSGYGLKEVSCKLYPGARHELLNEINRDEVMQDVADWLNRNLQ